MDLLLKAPVEYEPQLKNRFIVHFPSDIGIQSWAVKAVSAPKISINKQTIPFLNTETYVIGKYKWEEMTFTIHEFLGPSQSQAVMEYVRLHSESVTGRQGYAVSYKRDIVIEKLDPTGVAVSQWILKSSQVVNADFGGMDHGDDKVLEITMTVQPAYCILSF